MNKYGSTSLKHSFLFVAATFLMAASLACSLASPLSPPTPTATFTPLPTSSPTPVPPPEILYSEDFSDQYSGWLTGTPPDNPDSTFQYVNGEYIMTRASGTDGVNWVFARQDFYDSVISVDVRHISGDTNVTGPIIFWRVSKDFDSYYWLFVYGNGQFSVQKVSDGQTSVIRNWEFTNAIQRGQKVNHIDIKSVGDVHTIYINGIEVATFTDSGSLHGDIALGVTVTVQSGIEAAFDNLVVYSPENWLPMDDQ